METEKQQRIDRKQILKQLQVLLEPWLVDTDPADEMDEDTNLLADLGIDSVGILQLVLGVEKEFDITIKNDELDSEVFSRAGNFVNTIESKIYEDN